MVSSTTAYTHTAASHRIERYEASPNRSASSKAYHFMKSGEAFRVADLAERIGCTPGALSLLMKTMQAAGFSIASPWAGSTKLYRVTRHPPDYAAEEVTQATKRAAVAAVARDLPTEPPAPFPTLGGQLQVRALALDEAGQLAMQLSDGNGRSWRVVVTGHVL
jgi:hypothetical protein